MLPGESARAFKDRVRRESFPRAPLDTLRAESASQRAAVAPPIDPALDAEVARLEAVVIEQRRRARADTVAHYREAWRAERDPTDVSGRRARMLEQLAEVVTPAAAAG
ncbi:MAG: hypothetical protein EBZ59_09085 [Planctomycetia bacterium]|nr:hypothetical protein [Planctomycetia bacterium]